MGWNPFARRLDARTTRHVRDLEERVAALEDHQESLLRRFDKWSAKQRMRDVREGNQDAQGASMGASGAQLSAPVDSGSDRSAVRAALRERARMSGFLPKN